MSEWDKEELRSFIEEEIEYREEENFFRTSMGENILTIEYSDSVIDQMVDFLYESDDDREEKEMRYRLRLYDKLISQIKNTGEIVIYSDGYSANDYLVDGKLSSKVYWDLHGKYSFPSNTYEQFIDNGMWDEMVHMGLHIWKDIFLCDGQEETWLICLMSKEMCKQEHLAELKYAIQENDPDYERILNEQGMYGGMGFNDIVITPKNYGPCIDLNDIAKGIRWFVKKRMKITEKFNIRYATLEEFRLGRKGFFDKMKDKDDDLVEVVDDPFYYFSKFNVPNYFGTYIWKEK